MVEEINKSLKDYRSKWQHLISGSIDRGFFKKLKPVAVGWKVADRKQYDSVYAELHEQCDRTVETWMNDRWIAKMHLRKSKLTDNIEIIKLMQRRPNSKDAVGLDHVDFYGPEVVKAEKILGKETSIKWTIETNDVLDDYKWISIWFDNTEAKLKSSTVMDIIITELKQINQKIKSDSK